MGILNDILTRLKLIPPKKVAQDDADDFEPELPQRSSPPPSDTRRKEEQERKGQEAREAANRELQTRSVLQRYAIEAVPVDKNQEPKPPSILQKHLDRAAERAKWEEREREREKDRGIGMER